MGTTGLHITLAVAAALVLRNGAAVAAIIHVPGDWPTIQMAIDAASNGDEIVVAQGTYFESINFLGKAVTVRSTDPQDPQVVTNTIIAALIPGLRTVTCENGEGPDTVLNGFVITYVTPVGTGGGMYNYLVS